MASSQDTGRRILHLGLVQHSPLEDAISGVHSLMFMIGRDAIILALMMELAGWICLPPYER